MITQLLHSSIMVANTERSIQFYQDILGFSLRNDRPDLGYAGAWFEIGEQQLHLIELPNVDPTEGRPAHTGRDRHIAFACNNIDELIVVLNRNEIVFTKSASGRNAIFFRDPDGNGLEIVG